MQGEDDDNINNIDVDCSNDVYLNASKRKRKLPVVLNSDGKYRLIQSQLNNTNTSTTMNVNNKPQTPTSNMYAILTDKEEETNTAALTRGRRKLKIPPIITTTLTHRDICELIKQLNINNFQIKYMSIGIKTLFESIEDYNTFIDILKESKTNFFTHDIPSEKSTKFVLSGLPEFDINYIKEGLTEANVPFHEVKKMNIKIKRFDQQALYLVYFTQNIKLSDLKKSKSVLNVIVDWRPYTVSRNGPTQCNNCQLYGHGEKNCWLPPRCCNCGKDHKSLYCPVYKEASFTPKCCLCGSNHSSKDRVCPKRNDFMLIKSNNHRNIRSKNTNTVTNSSVRFTTTNHRTTQQSPLVSPNRQFSSWFNNSTTVLQQPPPLTQAQSSSTDNLFSAEELIQITTELIASLRSCKTSIDQFAAITKIAIKFGVSCHNV